MGATCGLVGWFRQERGAAKTGQPPGGRFRVCQTRGVSGTPTFIDVKTSSRFFGSSRKSVERGLDF